MDARSLLRRYLEQRRELGETELVLDGLNVEDVMRLLGAAGKSTPMRQQQRSVREMAGGPSQDWRESLRDAGVNVETVSPAPSVSIESEIESATTIETQNDMAFKKGIVIPPSEAELVPSVIEKLRSLEEISEKVRKCTRCPLY